MTSPLPGYIVVGATGGIGRALVARLQARGARLAVAARDGAAVRALAGEVGAHGVVLDARNPDETEAAFAGAVEEIGGIDGVVNLAGSILLKPAHRTSTQEWNDVIATNLTTAFSVVRAAVPHLRRGGGSIVLASSAAARHGFANHEAIAAAKAGIEGLTRAAAASYASHGLRVNAVAPGLVRTALAEPLLGNEAAEKASAGLHALGRVGEADEVASLIDWLLQRDNAWVTGQVFGIDGGLSAVRSRR